MRYMPDVFKGNCRNFITGMQEKKKKKKKKAGEGGKFGNVFKLTFPLLLL